MKPIDITGQRFGKLTAVSYETIKGRRFWTLKCDCGNMTYAGIRELNAGKRVSCGCAQKERFNLVGKKFGMLTVVERVEDRNNRPYYNCICDCGEYYIASSKSLNRGSADNCGCMTKEKQSKRTKPYGESMRNKVLSSYKSNAKRRGLAFDINDNRAFELFQGDCYYCGAAPSHVATHASCYGEYIHNGIDRLNNELGYVEGNVVSCCKTCNYLKGGYSEAEFLSIIKRIAEHMNL